MAARSVAQGVALQFGLVSTSVSLFSAVESKSGEGNVLVCDAGHDPQQIRAPKVCGQCGEVPVQQLKKARRVDGGLVLLTEDDLAAVKEDAEQFKKLAAVRAHPAEQVEVSTGVGDKAYFLTPDKGNETTYAVLRSLVERHPEVAFLARWTPRSSCGQFRLRVHEGVLMFQERVSGDRLRETPDIADLAGQMVDDLTALAEKVMAVTPYDADAYADNASAVLAERIKGREVIPTAGSPAPQGNDLIDLMERLQAAARAEAKKPAQRKSRAKASA